MRRYLSIVFIGLTICATVVWARRCADVRQIQTKRVRVLSAASGWEPTTIRSPTGRGFEIVLGYRRQGLKDFRGRIFATQIDSDRTEVIEIVPGGTTAASWLGDIGFDAAILGREDKRDGPSGFDKLMRQGGLIRFRLELDSDKAEALDSVWVFYWQSKLEEQSDLSKMPQP